VLVDGIDIEAREHLVAVGVSLNLGRIEVELLAPDETGLLALLHDAVEEAAKAGDTVAVPDLAQSGMVWECFV
jgi:hypothetical protein